MFFYMIEGLNRTGKKAGAAVFQQNNPSSPVLVAGGQGYSMS